MSILRPDRAAWPGARGATRHRRALSLRAAFALMALSCLAACANEEPLALPVPPHPDVPQVQTDVYPTVGTTQRTGRSTLSTKQQSALQKDLESLAKNHERKVESAIDAGN